MLSLGRRGLIQPQRNQGARDCAFWKNEARTVVDAIRMVRTVWLSRCRSPFLVICRTQIAGTLASGEQVLHNASKLMRRPLGISIRGGGGAGRHREQDATPTLSWVRCRRCLKATTPMLGASILPHSNTADPHLVEVFLIRL